MAKKYTHHEDNAPMTVNEPIVEYASAPIIPSRTQITVNIADASMLKEIKHAISMIRGVVSIEKSQAVKSYERARADVKAGRVVQFDSLDDLKAYYDKL